MIMQDDHNTFQIARQEGLGSFHLLSGGVNGRSENLLTTSNKITNKYLQWNYLQLV